MSEKPSASLFPFFSNEKFRCPRYCIVDERRGKYAIIFPEIPFWVIARKETIEVFKQMDGSKSLEQIVEKLISDYQISFETASQFVLSIFSMLKAAVTAVKEKEAAGEIEENKTLLANQIDLTLACNLRCKHCAPIAGHALKEELSTKQVKRYISECIEITAPNGNLTFTGGEPLLRLDLLELVEHAIAVGYRDVQITTNGLLIDSRFIEYVQKNKEIVSVQVSLDGLKGEHEWLRGSNTWKKVLEKIESLKSAGCKVGVACCVHRRNFSSIIPFLKFLREKNLNLVGLLTLIPKGRAIDNKLERVPEHETIKLIHEHLSEFEDVSIGVPLFNPILTLRTCMRFLRCGVGVQGLNLRSNGDLFPCFMVSSPNYKLGNIKKDSVLKIWKNSPILHFLRSLTINTLNKCRNCEFRFFCGGGCRGTHMLLTGDIKGIADPLCNDFKKSLIECMWIIKDFPTYLKQETTRHFDRLRRLC